MFEILDSDWLCDEVATITTDVCDIFFYLHFSSTICILETRNLWILASDVTVSNVASTMNSGKRSLDSTFRLYISPVNT